MTAASPIGPQVRLRPYRVAVGLTLDQLRDRIAEHGVEVSMPHLSNVECGHQRASERLLRAWALAVGLDPLDVWQPRQPSVVVGETGQSISPSAYSVSECGQSGVVNPGVIDTTEAA